MGDSLLNIYHHYESEDDSTEFVSLFSVKLLWNGKSATILDSSYTSRRERILSEEE